MKGAEMTTTVKAYREAAKVEAEQTEGMVREKYVAAVRKAADGQKLAKADVEDAASAADLLGLDIESFDSDVEAMRRHDDLRQQLDTIADAGKSSSSEQQELRSELDALEKRVMEIRLRQRKLVAHAMMKGPLLQTLNDLRSAHRHIWPNGVTS